MYIGEERRELGRWGDGEMGLEYGWMGGWMGGCIDSRGMGD